MLFVPKFYQVLSIDKSQKQTFKAEFERVRPYLKKVKNKKHLIFKNSFDSYMHFFVVKLYLAEYFKREMNVLEVKDGQNYLVTYFRNPTNDRHVQEISHEHLDKLLNSEDVLFIDHRVNANNK